MYEYCLRESDGGLIDQDVGDGGADGGGIEAPAVGVDPIDSVPKTMKASNAEMKKVRQATPNSMRFVIKCLVDPFKEKMTWATGRLNQPIRKIFGQLNVKGGRNWVHWILRSRMRRVTLKSWFSSFLPS